jgi:hypothetical protein
LITENLNTLKIHKLTQAQYDRILAAGEVDENALYLTPVNDAAVLAKASETFILTAANWSTSSNGNVLMCVVESPDNHFTNGTLFVSPSPIDNESYNEYLKCGVRCVSSTDGVIAFMADTLPTIDLTVNITSFM